MSPNAAVTSVQATSGGRLIDVEVEIAPIRGRGDAVVGMSTIARDITVAKRAQQGIAELIQGTISEKARFTTDFAADTPTIEGDVTQLRQVVLTLITNASEAIGEESGTIAGMTDETRARIFEPLFTTKFTGRGLGLAAVQGIVRSHGGAIRIYSEPGHGTSLKIVFPAAAAEARATGSSDSGPPEWRGSGTVVVADDSDGMRDMARVMLESLGFDVIEARDGSVALDTLKQHEGELAFALIDQMMPGMTGDEVVAELERLGTSTPIVLSSGYNAQQVTQGLTGSGIAEFLQKPYELRHLRAIARAVTGEPEDGA